VGQQDRRPARSPYRARVVHETLRGDQVVADDRAVFGQGPLTPDRADPRTLATKVVPQ